MMSAVCVPVCLCAEQPVHVVDAGSGFPPVRPAGRGDTGQTSLSHHSSRPAAGYTRPAGGKRKLIVLEVVSLCVIINFG